MGLDGGRLHDLRHAWATMQLRVGTEIRVVSDLLGHATIAFTLQTYVHPNDADAGGAATRSEELLGAAVSWGESGANHFRR